VPLPPAADSADLFALHDVLGDALVMLDTDGRVVAANDTGDRLLAVWSGRIGSELAVAPGATPALSDWIRRTLAGGPRSTQRVSDPIAQTVWDCALVPWPGRVQWVLRAHEITDLAARHEEAESALQNFRLLTAQMRDMLILVRIEGPDRYVCEAVNPAYLAATGLREDEVVGRRPDELLPPAEAAFAMLACARIGAVHSVVFGGFAAKELATRIEDATPKVILAATCGIEGDAVDSAAQQDLR
jgi:PAS domain-containing protein